jgi:hypothetical protein
MTTPQPGLYPGVKREIYFSWDAVNQSLLKKGTRSWAHARAYQLRPPAPTPALETGNAMHMAILEPELFEKEYQAPPLNPETHQKWDRRSKAGKAAWAEAEATGGTILPMKDWMFVLEARRAAWDQPPVKALLGGKGLNEMGVVWVDEETGVTCKALIDRLTRWDDWTWVIDLKSTVDGSPDGWPKQVMRYGYHIQAPWYLDGLAAHDAKPTPRRFCFLTFEKEDPFVVQPYACTEGMLEQGRAEYRKLLRQYAECLETDVWPGYGGEMRDFHLPEWAYREVSDDE